MGSLHLDPTHLPIFLTGNVFLYFGNDFMLRRLDYTTDVLGGVAADYCYDPVTIDGLVFPTLRRVVRRTPEGPLLSGRTSFILDYTNLVVRK